MRRLALIATALIGCDNFLPYPFRPYTSHFPVQVWTLTHPTQATHLSLLWPDSSCMSRYLEGLSAGSNRPGVACPCSGGCNPCCCSTILGETPPGLCKYTHTHTHSLRTQYLFCVSNTKYHFSHSGSSVMLRVFLYYIQAYQG
jgi:hypothetical protein